MSHLNRLRDKGWTVEVARDDDAAAITKLLAVPGLKALMVQGQLPVNMVQLLIEARVPVYFIDGGKKQPKYFSEGWGTWASGFYPADGTMIPKSARYFADGIWHEVKPGDAVKDILYDSPWFASIRERGYYLTSSNAQATR